eukprot:s3252_g20.t1
MATTLSVELDPIPIGRGAVKIFVEGELAALFNKTMQMKVGSSTPTYIELSGDSFEWQFIYDLDKVSADKEAVQLGTGGSMEALQKTTEAITDENLGYRLYVLPCFEATTLEEVKEKRQLVMDQQLLVHQIVKLHSKTVDGGLVGADKALQEEIDSAVLMLLSYLAHLGEERKRTVQVHKVHGVTCRRPLEDEPHAAITSEAEIFSLMYNVLLSRPSVADLRDPAKRMSMTDEHVAASRFYYGLSLSEQGRSNFVHYQQAVEKESANSIGVGYTPGSVVDPHEVTCHDRGYIIKTLTNFSCTPATWTLPNTLLLLRPDSEVLFTECEFARGSTSWSLSFHTYLNEEFNSPGKARWLILPFENALLALSAAQEHRSTDCLKTLGNRAGYGVQLRSVVPECLCDPGELTWAEEIPNEIQTSPQSPSESQSVNIFGFKSLEPNEALFNKRREESGGTVTPQISRSAMLRSPSACAEQLGQTLAAARSSKLPGEAQRRSAVFALRNLADPAVTAGLHGAQRPLGLLHLEGLGFLSIGAVWCTCSWPPGAPKQFWTLDVSTSSVSIAEAPPGRERRVEEWHSGYSCWW